MDKFLFITILFFTSLNAYQFENKDVESISKVIQKEYIKCLDDKKIKFYECNSVKETKLKKLLIIDNKESYTNYMVNVKDNREKQSKLPPAKLTSAAEIVKNNMDYCLEKSVTIEDNKACIKSLQEGKFRLKQQNSPIPTKNKVHIELESEKPDLSTLFSNKVKIEPIEVKKSISVENRNTEVKEGKYSTIIKNNEVIVEQVVTPKKKVRFKN